MSEFRRMITILAYFALIVWLIIKFNNPLFIFLPLLWHP